MTSTTLMPVRVSLRRDPHHGHSPDQPDSEPPAKRARLQTHSSSRRRKSSPDLLDTTTTENSSSSAATPYKLSSHHPLRRRTSTRRPLASNNPTSSSPATPRPNARRILRNDSTPTITSYFFPVGRESPDPLDTISPSATANSSVSRRVSPPGRPSAVTTTAAASSARRPRRSAAAADPEPDVAVATPIQQPASTSTVSKPSQPVPDATPQQPTAPTEQPSTGREQRRSLRSHDGGSRARSELALYFPNYEELLSMEPPKTEFLAGNTTIKLLDDLPEPLTPSSDPNSDTDTPFGNPLVNLHNCETINLPNPPSSTSRPKPPTAEDSTTTSPDPLSEETYFRPHRRNERQEKQLRNIERDRAQHEKQNLDRLLDELQGHDWLRVMGITGLISDPERKHFESKRTYFIREISAVLQKFKIWREEEKRRKSEKDKPAEEEPIPPTASSSKKDHSPETATPSTNDEADDGTTPLSDAQSCGGDPPDPNDVDAWAARQLHQEARSATTTTPTTTTNPTTTSTSTGKKLSKPSSSTKHKSTSAMHPPPAPAQLLPPEPTKPFTSFYSKPHLRELALSGPNRKGRTRLAFGQPIPEMEEREFELPAEILTPEAIDSCRRKRRRMKRASGRGETG
ncbi:hypothetical protein CBS63078_4103 [Aspergillus niger]|uniref:Something about silencing protein 4 domain-containing protein n=4 Tax=Aspergillus TaxID=5052 RepID=A0A370PQ33_ASPPH|nr:hypothetical protein ASPNIDRAFT_45558 [Aspergillus niger ATCC 1015]KAI2812271.1 hypothetical protein CBS115989_10623 [Aspergillus niger]RDH14077.1 hypothetical protein M747DRAFT_291086 [Aspergillus niger ATCC 13496]RDK44298.1 hypothetical protein M752DRAFT_274660 [Aspergillus phoenicis ATCC 13157]KAI2819145.1 hypothetical protein CBS133816_10163 [Aspergillus niger]